MTTADILIEARALIAEYGWLQGRSGNKAVGFCTVGAINNTHTKGKLDALKAFGEANGVKPIGTKILAGGAVAWWNDSFAWNKEMVLAAFDKAITHIMDQNIGEEGDIIIVEPIPEKAPIIEPMPQPVREPEKVPA